MRASILGTVLVLSVGVAADFQAQSPESRDARLSVSIAADRTHYELGNKICLDVRLINVGGSVVSVFGRLLWGYAGGLVLVVTDATGQEVPAKVLDDDLIIPSELEDRNSFVVLRPDHYIGTARVQAIKELVREPGTYSMQVLYKSTIGSAFGKGPGFWSRDKPPVWSNKIRVHITGR